MNAQPSAPPPGGLNQVAARGFGTAGKDYERGRPDYPPGAVAALVHALGLGPGRRVLDVGAGTGKLARRLRPSGAWVAAVEPVAAMRAGLAGAEPGLPQAGGAAEALPVAAGAVDGAVVGTAFHWFDGPVALRELHRVLRPGGRLGLVWLARDESVDWVAELVQLVDGYKRGDPPRYTDGRWRRAFETTPYFGPLEEAVFPFAHVADRETALARVASTSFVGALGAAEREAVLRRVADLLDQHPATRGRETLALPYRADVFVARRRD
jgi:SAM-dependent methyltransferase